MRPKSPLLFLPLLASMISGCAQRDPLEEAAWQASRVGTAVGDASHGSGTAGLEAGARITERFYYVAKYQASMEQRRVAEAIARRSVAQVAQRTSASTRKPARYLAVPTRSDHRSTTKANVMIWDTVTRELVGNTVYDLNEEPPPSANLKLDVYSTQYVGASR